MLEKRKGGSRPPYGTLPRSLLSTPSTALPSVDPNTRRFYSSLLLVLAGRELDHSRAILWILAPYRSSSTIEPRSRSVELRCGLSRETVGSSAGVTILGVPGSCAALHDDSVYQRVWGLQLRVATSPSSASHTSLVGGVLSATCVRLTSVIVLLSCRAA